jgi:hypothetical protein
MTSWQDASYRDSMVASISESGFTAAALADQR